MIEEPEPKPKPATTALTPTAGTGLDFYQRINDPIEAVNLLGLAFSQSRMFGCKNDSQGRVLAMACLCERRSPVELMREYHLIEGNLTLKADAMLARFRAAGGEHIIVERSAERAAITLKMKRQKPQDFSFTWEEAKAESYVYCKDGKTLKDNWSTPRRRMQMLWARLVSDAVRALAPECVAGHYTPEDFGHHQDDTITVEAEVVEQAEPVAEEKPESELTPEPALEPTPPAEAPPEKTTREQLVEMKGLKDQLGYGADVWKQILEKFGVATAKDLAPEEADRVLLWLHKQANKASSKNELEQWANNQMPF